MEEVTHTAPAQRPSWVPLILGALLALLALFVWSNVDGSGFTARFDPLESTDIDQSRLDTSLPAPTGQALVQTFVPRHNGLYEVEITLLRYGEAEQNEQARLTLQLLDEQGAIVSAQSHPTAALAHNQQLRLQFPPQNDSKGRQYRLQISTTPDGQVSAWGYSLDVYADGQLMQAEQSGETTALPAQDLRFVTRYRLTWTDALVHLAETLFYEAALFLLALLFLPLPGVLLLLADHAYRVRQLQDAETDRQTAWDPAAWWGVALALGVSAWPVLWLWLTMFRGRWTDWLLALVIAGGWLAALGYWWRERTDRRKDIASVAEQKPALPITLPWRWDHLVLLAILLLGFFARLVAVRDTPVLPWVDASRHALITAVMAQSGQTISNFAPYLPVERFPYHFGLHTLTSSLFMLSDWPLERLLLYIGQLLNGLVPFTVFAAIWLLVRRRRAGYLGAFLVALPFFFPAYYTTWGRLTQLTAVLILPVLIAFTWQLVRGSDDWIDRWWLLGILVSGLFLVHFRVLAYWLPFPLLVLLVSRLRRARWLLAAATLAFVLTFPRIVTLLDDTDPVQRLSRTIPNYNNFPTSYVTTGWERVFIIAAAAALLFVLVAALRRQTWTLLPLTLAGWVASLFALLSLDRVGLPVPSLFNINSMYIMLFIPLAIFLAVVAGQVWQWLDRQDPALRLAGYGLTGALLALLLVYGIRRQVTILNEQTLLVKTEDLIALHWLDRNLPQEASIAVNSWQWLGETWAASDGGAWILPLTGRSVTTPPIDHIYNADLFQQVRQFNQEAMAVSDWSDPAQADWLVGQGVSHIFVGKRGGYFDPAKLSANPRMDLLYDHDGVFIFAVNE